LAGPQLTRRRDRNDRLERWQIWFDRVEVGSIGRQSGAPKHAPQWEWSCGFYPGSKPKEHGSGVAVSYEAARAAFRLAWLKYLPRRSLADFDTWRHHQAWMAEKNARWERGERAAPPWPLPGFRLKNGPPR
jgi:hypothetical protein